MKKLVFLISILSMFGFAAIQDNSKIELTREELEAELHQEIKAIGEMLLKNAVSEGDTVNELLAKELIAEANKNLRKYSQEPEVFFSTFWKNLKAVLFPLTYPYRCLKR